MMAMTFRRYARAAGVIERERVTPHTLRHIFASELLRARANLRQIQELLDHRRLDSTQRYTRVTAHELHGASSASASPNQTAVRELRLPNEEDQRRSTPPAPDGFWTK